MKSLWKAMFVAIIVPFLISPANADMWGDNTNFAALFADSFFTLQIGRSPIMEQNGTNIDYGLTMIGHYEQDEHVDDFEMRVKTWSVGPFLRYPVFNWSGVDAPVQGKLYVDAALVMDTRSMEDWYVPLGVSAHVLLDRKINEAGHTCWELMAVGGYKYVKSEDLYGDSNLFTGGIVIRWRD